ncbi:MAG: YcaO-like family protein [Deltaproteobacteria bacterium]|nr:YcaO-like family protein [Deltaproteobacteria bacterium]
MNTLIELKDSFKSYTYDQDKVISPDQTVATIKERLARIQLDILKEVVRIDTGRLDIPVYLSFCGSDAFNTIGTKKQMGKGATPIQAEASALMELMERFSFFHFVKGTDFMRASYDNLAEQALPFPLIAASVHHPADDLAQAYQAIKDLPLEFTQATNLTQGRDYLVPFNWFYEINEFNGPSAGNSLEEAIVQGLGEVVERHVSALVCEQRLVCPDIDLGSVTDPVARELIAKYRSKGIVLKVKDFTLGLGIPSIGALAYDPENFPGRSEIVFTAGTATSPEKALIRALTEVAQLAGDFESRPGYIASGLPKFNHLGEADYVFQSTATIALADLPNPSDDNLKTEIVNCTQALARHGLEVLVLETTHPLLQVPAVYVMIPGARFRERASASSVDFFAAKLATKTYPPEQALAYLEYLKGLYPARYYLHFYSGMARLEKQDYTGAIDELKQALALHPHEQDLASIYCHLGIAFKEAGDFEEAIAQLQQALEYDTERSDVHNLLGFCCYKLKRYQEAIKRFEEAIRHNPGSAIDYANIGVNLRALGFREEAKEMYRMALDLDPRLDFARDHLSELE